MGKYWLILISFLIISVRPARAENEFITDYQVNYQIGESGLTRATIEVKLTNRLSNIYASEFNLSIGSTKLSDIRLISPARALEPKVVTGNQTTNISVVFPEKVLGKDNYQEFILEFTTSDFARRLGNIWEISIPRLAKSDLLNTYNLNLIVPAAFGPPAAMTPVPNEQISSGNHLIYRFSGENLFNSGISATFGEQQHYDFSFTYHLKNDKFYPIETEIALPPDTVWQQVLYGTIAPPPNNVRVDGDGNWLAGYRLGPAMKLDIVATGSATLFLKPRSDYPFGLNTEIDYLKPLKYWEADQEPVQSAAAGLTTPRKIYDFVVDNLIYDYGRLGETPTRLGAANALDNRDSALCLEFTDLFVALARANGINARAVNGYAFTDNSGLRPLSLKQDVLHAWPEFYDTALGQWRPVDPTWGNTTGGVDFFSHGDLNHFAFAILGEDSVYPIPAGAYKVNGDLNKNIQVEFGQSLKPDPGLSLELNLPASGIAGLDSTGQITVINTGNQALSAVPVSLRANRLKPDPSYWELNYLPPKSRVELEFTLPAGGWSIGFTDTLTVVSDYGSLSRDFNLQPAYRLILEHRYFRWSIAALTALVVLKLIYARIHRRQSAK